LLDLTDERAESDEARAAMPRLFGVGPDRAPCSLEDLAAFFRGTWRMRRRFNDQRLGLVGRFVGTARFVPGGGRLDYEEAGTLDFGNHRGRASQRYLYLPLGPAVMAVCFADGRLFHTLDLSRSLAHVAHECADDHYRGRYRIMGGDCWSQAWRVEGPRKHLSIVTLFRRVRG
jgi:uncharacterized protein DUF6314